MTKNTVSNQGSNRSRYTSISSCSNNGDVDRHRDYICEIGGNIVLTPTRYNSLRKGDVLHNKIKVKVR